MSLERSIHDRWATYAPLVSLVPANDVRTMWMADDDPALPYVVITREGEPSNRNVSNGLNVTTRTLRFSIFASSLGDVKDIAQAAYRRYHRTDFDLIGSRGRVYYMAMKDRDETKDDDGTYIATLDFTVVAGEYQ